MTVEATTTLGAQTNTDAPDAGAATTSELETQETSSPETDAGEQEVETTEQEAGASKESKPEEDAPGAPEEYEAFNFGENGTLDEGALGVFHEWGKKYNIPQEGMQALVDMQNELNARHMQAIQAEREGWVKAVQDHPQFGGENLKTYGPKMSAIVDAGDDADGSFRKFLNTTGLGDHPEMVFFFGRLTEKVGEDVLGGTRNNGASPSKKQVSLEDRLWPDKD